LRAARPHASERPPAAVTIFPPSYAHATYPRHLRRRAAKSNAAPSVEITVAVNNVYVMLEPPEEGRRGETGEEERAARQQALAGGVP
jgi:hypothetical protein